jgi:hypothetical protein
MLSTMQGSEEGPKSKGLQFSDKDEHMYFWFPLLAGLSELTFDPRQEIRYSALEVHPLVDPEPAPQFLLVYLFYGPVPAKGGV